MIFLNLAHAQQVSCQCALKLWTQGDEEVKVMSLCVTHHTQIKNQDTLTNLEILQQQSEFCFHYICITFSSFSMPPLADAHLYMV